VPPSRSASLGRCGGVPRDVDRPTVNRAIATIAAAGRFGPAPTDTRSPMGLFRGRDEAPHVKYQMREKMISIGDDYWIEDESGDKAFKVNGKALRVRDTWKLEDRTGNTVAEIQEKKLSIRDKIEIELPGGRSARVKKAMVGFRDRFHVDVDDGPDLKVHGNIVDHEYEIERDGDKIAEISKKWFRVRDTYGVEIFDVKETVLLLAITVAVDALAHDPL
jgi:uncharacterized protein YxjI